jgi:Ca-activated chloride channel family protein
MGLRIIVTALLASLSVAIAAQQGESPTFLASSSELVVLPVTVLDKRGGGFVTNLSRERFAVYDNGRRQDISLFTNEDTPVTIGLIIDNSGSMGRKMGEVIVGTTALARSSNPEDELFTVAFNDAVVEAGSRAVLTAADGTGLESQLRSMIPRGRTALYDALVAGLDRLEHGAQARKALVLMSDGGDNASRATLNEVLARARRANVTIFTIGLFDGDDPDRNPGVLKSLAETTGGERFLPQSPSLVLQACTRIARELRSGYTIGFIPTDRDGAFHRVRVEVKPETGGKVAVRTRPGYFAASSAARPNGP